MAADELPHRWAHQLGLAISPLFGSPSHASIGSHDVLLDGNQGSFALSVTSERLWNTEAATSWAWSSNLAHHVTVTDDAVAVRRWDQPRSEVFSRKSVELRLDAFFEFLAEDRVRSSSDIVQEMLSQFWHVRTFLNQVGIPDEQSVVFFLTILRDRIPRETYDTPSLEGAEIGSNAVFLSALRSSRGEALHDKLTRSVFPDSRRLLPSLAIRHAGSEFFQEIHSTAQRNYAIDTAGLHGSTGLFSRGGVHFTPPALARLLVEQTLHRVENLASQQRLVIMDPVCGTGTLLYEALRALRRLAYQGSLVVIGRDISRSAVAISKFVMEQATADWSPPGGMQVDIQVGDMLDGELPFANVILMNPPFGSWNALDNTRRNQMQEILGARLRGRADLSMAFITRAMVALADGGACGFLFPSNLLAQQAAEAWRASLLKAGNLAFIASLGDYGLSAHSVVQTGAAVFSRAMPPRADSVSVTALITSDRADATRDAFRTLRRYPNAEYGAGEDKAWQLFKVPQLSFSRSSTWRLRTPKTEMALSRLLRGGAVRISNLFTVRQGVRSGDNRAFVLDEEAFNTLPAVEKRYFKPAIMDESVQDGRIQDLFWIFYPYGIEGALIANEEELFRVVPYYAQEFLAPRRKVLMSRASLTQGERNDWWGLSRNRLSWSLNTGPHIVSSYKGGPGTFATDLRSRYIVVQGFAWLPKWELPAEHNKTRDDEDETNGGSLSTESLLLAYSALMNSSAFGRMLELFAPHVAGGQFDLSARYVDPIPMPDLRELARDERLGTLVSRLSRYGRDPRPADVEWSTPVDFIAADLYGRDAIDDL